MALFWATWECPSTFCPWGQFPNFPASNRTIDAPFNFLDPGANGRHGSALQLFDRGVKFQFTVLELGYTYTPHFTVHAPFLKSPSALDQATLKLTSTFGFQAQFLIPFRHFSRRHGRAVPPFILRANSQVFRQWMLLSTFGSWGQWATWKCPSTFWTWGHAKTYYP